MSPHRTDFAHGDIRKNMIDLALPLLAAQILNLLYNVVDRIYIARIPEVGTDALTGLGICFPIIAIITAFGNLFSMGGTPLCAMRQGEGREEEAENIIGNVFVMLLITSAVLMATIYPFRQPILYVFGASDVTFPYANDYLSIYLLGTFFAVVGLGMNNFINCQGFGRTGMITIAIGAVANIILDPIFIFLFDMGVKGAAIATIISQGISALWVMKFMTGPKAVLKLRIRAMKVKLRRITSIVSLGLSSFVMSVTGSAVQVVANSSLQFYGGDLYVCAITVINTIRDIVTLPALSLSNGSIPALSYRYGAKAYDEVRRGIRFLIGVFVSYAVIAWGILLCFPRILIRIFNSDPALLEIAVPSLRMFFLCFCMMALQFSGQTAFLALGKAKQATFFSPLRKAFIVIPLMVILPRFDGIGVHGIFLAEPISDLIGGGACFLTMILTVLPELKKKYRHIEHSL